MRRWISWLLGLTALRLYEWAVIFGVGLSLLLVVEFAKRISNHMHPAPLAHVPASDVRQE